MGDIEILARLLLAIGFGAILGLETETRTSEEEMKNRTTGKLMRQRLGGVRTYTVLALFGALGGIFYQQGNPIFSYLIFVAIFLIVFVAYILNVQFQHAFGLTTEIAILITTLLGFAATSNLVPVQILIVIVLVLTFILSQKQGVAYIARKVAHDEVIDVLKFLIVALVVFPFIPNQDFAIRDIAFLNNIFGSSNIRDLILINPFKLWQYIVLISGFNLLGYFANRIWGRFRGLILTGIFGGLVSSTSTIISLASHTRSVSSNEAAHQFAGAGLISNGISFIQLMVIAASVSIGFAANLLPVSIVLGVVSALVGIYYITTARGNDFDPDVKLKPFSLLPAVEFAVLLIIVRIVVQIATMAFGEGGFVFATSLSGFSGMDIAVISLAEELLHGTVDLNLAIFTFVLANMVNYVGKIVFAKIPGKSSFVSHLAIGLLISLLAGVFTLLIQLLH